MQRTPYIEFQQYRSIGLGEMFGYCPRDRWTFFLKHFFRMWEWYVIEIHLKNQSQLFLMIAILPSLLMSLQNKNLIFFLMWTTLNFRGRGKTKKTARDIYMRTLDVKFEWDWSIGLGSTFSDIHPDRHIHSHFSKTLF